jgi:hypothetical protein
MTSADIPELLEWRCMLPVQILRVTEDVVSLIVTYYPGLELRRDFRPDGVKFAAFKTGIFYDWLRETEDHFVELLGPHHGRGNLFGYDRKTKEVRSLYAEMKEAGYAVEDDE